jgi:dihydroxyacetone kinase-like protein
MSAFLTGVVDVVAEVRRRAPDLNVLDGRAGDGDLGVTMSLAADAVTELLPELETEDLAVALRAVGTAMALKAPSTAGTLVATGLLQAARAVGDEPHGDARSAATLLRAASDAIGDRGSAQPGDKTMVDALAPAAEAALDAAERGCDVAATLGEAADAADRGARATTEMTPRHGRAGWLADRSAGHEDGGARLIAIILGAAAASARREGPDQG